MYSVSPHEVGAYGCLLLVRHELRAEFSQVSFPSNMGRSLLVARCTPPPSERPFALATVHLESLNSARLRTAQLEVCRDALKPYDRAVLCGDFNFDSTQNFGDWRPKRKDFEARWRATQDLENSVLARVLPDYVDVWPAIHPDKPGHTFDGGRNPYVADANERMRYDRFMARGVEPVAIEMLGAGEHQPTPSDHYGLCAGLRLQ